MAVGSSINEARPRDVRHRATSTINMPFLEKVHIMAVSKPIANLSRKQDLSGLVFGRWTVLERAGTTKRNRPLWLCRCACGVVRETGGDHLKSGHSQSCGECTRRRMPTDDEYRELIRKSVEISASGCWEWAKGKTTGGYGSTSYRGKCLKAHRVSYLLFVGDPGSLFVCHRCDNRICVNPDHLFLGTAMDNVLDMVAKGRHFTLTNPKYGFRHKNHGENNGRARLNRDDVERIRELWANSNVSKQALADSFGVARTTICHIINRVTWK